MKIEPIKFIMPRFAYSDGRPAANIYIHLDILGDNEVRYQHFQTDEDGRILSGAKPAMLREGKYGLCATRNDVHDDLMQEYNPYRITITEGSIVQIPEDIVLEWAWSDVHEHIVSLEDSNKKLSQDMEDMKKEVEILEKKRLDAVVGGDSLDEEKTKILNIYTNIEIAKKKIEENWDLVEKGKTKLKVLLDKQEDTLQFLELAEKEKEELNILKRDLEEKKRQIDLIFKAIVGGELGPDGETYLPGEGMILDDDYMDGFYTDPDIDTLQKIKEHILNINEKRKQLEIAKEKILEARKQLKNRKDGMTALSDEMKETILQYDELLKDLQEEKVKLAKVKEKLAEGWEKLKDEYSERVHEVEEKFLLIEKEKALLVERKEQIRELLGKGRDHIMEERDAFGEQKERVKDHLIVGQDRIKDDKTEIIGSKLKLAELGTDLRKQSVRVKEAVIAKKKFEDKFDVLKEEEAALEEREVILRREQRKMDRDHTLRMEAYAQNDTDIEDEFKALDEMRELMSVQREDFVKDRLEYLKESMSYECPVCGGTIPVKSSMRPLRVQCPSCVTEFNLKVKQRYQCPECSETIPVTNTKRPLNVKCQKCASEFIIRPPFKYEEDIIPEPLKAKVPTH